MNELEVFFMSRFKFINSAILLKEVDSAIEDAKGYTGHLEPDECEKRRSELEALRKTLHFIFGSTGIVRDV